MKENSFQPNRNQSTKVIKRYGNRKLYDTEQSSYVVLSDIAKMIRNQEEVQVIDNETKNDITLSTLTQIIFGAEKKSNVSAPLDVLKSIIREGDGSFSSFLAKMGLFNAEDSTQKINTKSSYYKNSSTEERKYKENDQSVEQKVASVATSYQDPNQRREDENIPELPRTQLD